MTKPSMICVRTWGLTMAWGGLFSPFCGVLPVMVGASLSFPEVMAGGGVPGGALNFLAEPPPDKQMITNMLYESCLLQNIGRIILEMINALITFQAMIKILSLQLLCCDFFLIHISMNSLFSSHIETQIKTE